MQRVRSVFRIAIALSMACSFGCGRPAQSAANEVKTDIKPVERRFPKLVPIKQAFWQAEVLTKNASSSVPGPTQYRMRGFIVLDAAQANDFVTKFNWQEMPGGWVPSMKPPEKQWETGSWSRSVEFTKAIKSQLLIGEIYFDKAHQLLFFEIEGE